jgi:hypothetical protein
MFGPLIIRAIRIIIIISLVLVLYTARLIWNTTNNNNITVAGQQQQGELQSITIYTYYYESDNQRYSMKHRSEFYRLNWAQNLTFKRFFDIYKYDFFKMSYGIRANISGEMLCYLVYNEPSSSTNWYFLLSRIKRIMICPYIFLASSIILSI